MNFNAERDNDIKRYAAYYHAVAAHDFMQVLLNLIRKVSLTRLIFAVNFGTRRHANLPAHFGQHCKKCAGHLYCCFLTKLDLLYPFDFPESLIGL